MKTLAFAAALYAAFFVSKPADANVAMQLYSTFPPGASSAVNFSLLPGAQFMGDVFRPIAVGPVCYVDCLFVDTVGARTYAVVVSFFNKECLGCPAALSVTFNFTMPPLPNPPNHAFYRIRFPVSPPFNYNPLSPWVGISFHVTPPGIVPPYPPIQCPLGLPPTLVPAFGNFPATVGTEVVGISTDVQPQDCCLHTGLNLGGMVCPPGTEWFTPRNLLLTLWDCIFPPPPAMTLRGPSIDNPFDPSDDVTIELLDIRAIQQKEFINLADVDLKKS